MDLVVANHTHSKACDLIVPTVGPNATSQHPSLKSGHQHTYRYRSAVLWSNKSDKPYSLFSYIYAHIAEQSFIRVRPSNVENTAEIVC